MGTDKSKNNNKMTVRVYSETIWRNIEELEKTDAFDCKNDLLNKALEIGTESLLKHFSKAKALTAAVEVKAQDDAKVNEIAKNVRDLLKIEQDSSVLYRILEIMITTLYNVEVARIRGEEVSAELMDGGYFSDLPEQLAAVKNELYGVIEGDENE